MPENVGKIDDEGKMEECKKENGLKIEEKVEDDD